MSDKRIPDPSKRQTDVAAVFLDEFRRRDASTPAPPRSRGSRSPEGDARPAGSPGGRRWAFTDLGFVLALVAVIVWTVAEIVLL